MLQKYRINGNIPIYIYAHENMNENKQNDKENKQNDKENSEIINKLYSNNNVLKKRNSKGEYFAKTKLKDDGESEKYIKEMHDLADKNEFKNNLIVLVLGIVIVSIIIFTILMNTPLMKPKTDVAASKIVTKNTIDSTSTENSTIKPIATANKIYEYLDVETNRTTALKKAVELDNGSKKSVTVYLLSEILRANTIDIPVDTSTVKQLVTDLTSMGWIKNTNFTDLVKGDICFTTDIPDKPGSPSHAYVFMGWVKDGETDYAYVCDGQVEEYSNVLHKRNISISTGEKDKFGFFLRK